MSVKIPAAEVLPKPLSGFVCRVYPRKAMQLLNPLVEKNVLVIEGAGRRPKYRNN